LTQLPVANAPGSCWRIPLCTQLYTQIPRESAEQRPKTPLGILLRRGPSTFEGGYSPSQNIEFSSLGEERREVLGVVGAVEAKVGRAGVFLFGVKCGLGVQEVRSGEQ